MKNTPFSMLSYQSGLIASLALCSSMAQGAVTVSFSDSQAGLVVEWSGTLDVSSLTPSGDFLQDPPFGTLNGFGLSVVNTLDDLYAIQFGVEIVGGNIASNPIPLTSQILGSIDSFGFFVDFRDPELNGVIYVPDGFTSGSLNGEFLFPSLSVIRVNF